MGNVNVFVWIEFEKIENIFRIINKLLMLLFGLVIFDFDFFFAWEKWLLWRGKHDGRRRLARQFLFIFCSGLSNYLLEKLNKLWSTADELCWKSEVCRSRRRRRSYNTFEPNLVSVKSGIVCYINKSRRKNIDEFLNKVNWR